MTAPIALSMGDPAGIGPEITVKAWDALRAKDKPPVFCLIGCFETARRAAHLANLPLPVAVSDINASHDLFAQALPVLPIGSCDAISGEPSSDAANLITGSIAAATGLALEGRASAVVTNPIAKSVLYEAGFPYPGHTEYLGALTESAPGPSPRGPVMMLSGGGLRVALASVHLALADVPAALTTQRIVTVGRVMDRALKDYFGVKSPRIAITGLNPHAGESGAMGDEEDRIINPAAKALRGLGILATDAQPADTLFHAEAREGYDAVLAMYHDQGLIPVKTLDFHGGVNITLGLPIIRTSPDHGTAFAIAGKGIARPDSLIAALIQAQAMAEFAAQ